MTHPALPALLLALSLLAGAAAPGGIEGPPRPFESLGQDLGEALIEWKDGWAATYEANTKRWSQELQEVTKDRKLRAQLLSALQARLLEQLLARFPGEAGKLRAAYELLAERLAEAGCPARANHYLKRAVDEFPAPPDAAVAALQRMLTHTFPQRREIEGGDAWLDYATTRLLALSRAGRIPDGHPAVEQAWRTLLALAREEDDFWAASRALARLEAIAGRSVAWRLEDAELRLAAGRRDEALRLLDELAAEGADGRVASLLQELARERFAEAIELPRRWTLEGRWEVARAAGGAPDPGMVHALLGECAGSEGLVPLTSSAPGQRSVQASLWAAVDRELLACPQAALAPLRELQEREAARRVPAGRAARDPQALFALWRRYPWAAAAQRALADLAEDALLRGHAGLAWRVFEDVASHASDPALRARAKAGLALAAPASGRDPRPAPEPEPHPAVRNPQLLAPPAPPWAMDWFHGGRQELLGAFPTPPSLHAEAGRLIVAGPGLVACYGEHLGAPLWWRTPAFASGGRPQSATRNPQLLAPGAFRPAVAARRVFTRWGLDEAGRAAAIAAFEADTGELAWSTEGRPWWEDLSPVSDPAVADGRLYVLAIRGASPLGVPVWLVCLDAADGSLLWRRFLTSCQLALPRPQHHAGGSVDLASYGNPPLVHQGAVYCASNLGFVARCDARDGLVEWVRTYPRVRVGRNLSRLLARQGSSPLAAGDAVVFAPRDYAGVFALDRATGKLAWDCPFAPSDHAVGLASGHLWLSDREHLVALDATSGRLLWERSFTDGIAGRPILAGGQILLRTPRALWRIEGETGRTLERSDHTLREPARDMAVRGGQLIVVGDPLSVPPAPQSPAQAAPQPATQAAPLDLPLRRLWSLRRPAPELWEPPQANSKLADRLYLRSEGLLECLSRSSSGAILWRRALDGGVRGVAWAPSHAVAGPGARQAAAGDTMLVLYPSRVLALDALTGECRWETRPPIEVRDWLVGGDFLFVGNLKARREAAALRLASGELVWSRRFTELSGASAPNLECWAWDGQALRLYASRLVVKKEAPAELLVRPSDGVITAARPFPREGDPWPLQAAFGEGGGFVITQGKALCDYSFSDGSLRGHNVALPHLDPRRVQRIAFSGPWVQLFWDKGYDAEPDKHWLLKRGDTAFLLKRKSWGVIRGDTLYELPHGPEPLSTVDLRTGKAMAYQPPAAAGTLANVVDFRESGPRVLAVSLPHVERGQVVRVDAFDRAGGGHVGSQVLREVEPGGNQVAWASPGLAERVADALLITDAHGLHCFAAAPPAAPRARPVQVAHRLARPLPPGAALGDSDARDVIRLEREPSAPAGGAVRGSLRIAHDEHNLHLVVRYQDAAASPWQGPVGRSSGDWLELGLKTNQGLYRWALGLHPSGATRAEGLGPTPLPRGTRAVTRYDPLAREFSHELTLPWPSVFKPGDDWRRIGLWAVAWDDRPASGGQSPHWTVGRLDDRPGQTAKSPASTPTSAPSSVLPTSHPSILPSNQSSILPTSHPSIRPCEIYLDARTRDEDEAIAGLVHELPDLPISLELFKKSCESRAASLDDRLEWYWAFIERHPHSRAAEQLLADIELALRTAGVPDPTAKVLDRAAQAGVPEPVRRRHATQMAAYFSQWLYIEPNRQLRSVLLEFNTGLGLDEWGHRAYWGKPIANWIIPPCEMGTLEELPEAKWHELRVPLHLIGLHDKPICGINFCQQGPPRIFWDRSAVVAPPPTAGPASAPAESVLLDDELPAGQTRGVWEWVAEPRYSGARAHTQPPPAAHYEVKSHTITELDQPVVAHITPPLDRPYLSQWVYLDPAAPPRSLAISLHDGHGWAFRALWGDRTLRGRYMGPLPKPGQWHELCLPLAWTPFLSRAIAGIAFSHATGRVFWDRTALVAGGKEQVLIDDDAPPLRPPTPRQLAAPARREWHSWVDGHEGGTAPAPGRLGLGMLCDGISGCIRVPHAPELDPPQFTIEAWVYLDAFAPGSDTKQWILNKNGHAWSDGYFGLIIYRDKLQGDLNIGGEKENRFEAWSEEGTLKLKRWHHLAMTYDAATLKVYCDGQLVAHKEVNRERQPGRGQLFIGRWANGYSFFAGVLDEVRLYRRALTLDEIRARHADPAALTPAMAEAAVAHWGFDDAAAPEDPMSEWDWVTHPVKSGKRAHTSRPAEARPMPGPSAAAGAGQRAVTHTGHALPLLAEPLVAHLSFDRQRAAAFLEAQIPRVGATSEEAWQFFNALLELELPCPQRRIDLNLWFLKTFPGHPRAADVLGNLLDACRDAGEADPAGRVVALVKDLALPVEVFYHFHRKHARVGREFIRTWQIIGPFPGRGDDWGLDTPYPPEGQDVKLDRAYAGLGGDVRWQLFASEGSYVNLKVLFGPVTNAVAYAVTWVHSTRDRAATIAIGSDDRSRVWVNRRLALTGRNATYASAGEFVAPIKLAAGWNELLVKVTQGIGEWGFYFELLDELARLPPDGLRYSPTPPEANP